MSKKIGYKRVSTVDQNTARQLDGLQLDRVFEDKVSGKSTDRPAFKAMLNYVRDGDIIYVHSLDRFARNLDDLRSHVKHLTDQGVEICFIKEGLRFSDEENAMSKLLLSVMGAFAEFERNLILERQREGIALAKARGVYKGRRSQFTKNDKIEIKKLVDAGNKVVDIAKSYNVTRHTIYRVIKEIA